ncbi:MULTISPECIES: enoyl-CoA hydratase/isomerase family protein [Pseudoalteromonas]|uniref:3-hydroxyisobutyryl-CoA hydrolase n=1 Tax=Pseudoalteromonas amylolytica TaxID=1859457 RepID=A0A1S1MR38_9GAMM|nr:MULTISPECIES: enoyl-CoA hydratase/isomerase family protein [Pseudoalteromonas]OHU87009.1 enoyl-CoA hydratase [Pseudoalteromonas sp. JW3]OHU88282.1 enoyl-CoA hydratase [Pseudoalteromonas amylolytica]
MAKLQLLNDPDAPVLFELADCDNGMQIAFATLNVPKALNALNLDMIRLLSPQLDAWSKDDKVAMVVLKGEGEKAFCAGGDVVSLYKAMAANDGNDYVQTFFAQEYRLDYQIHTYEKPILLWGNGIIMGGGLGLMAGASHKVVTESARIAMPEITIGLYPDVGGSYFLNKMPQGVGLFLGLTGASINASDAQYVGLADHFVEADKYGELVAGLLGVDWSSTAQSNHEKLTQSLQELEQASSQPPHSALQGIQNQLNELNLLDSLQAQVDYILALPSDDNKWLSKAQKSLKHGSALSAVLVSEQLKAGQGKSLKECFMFELGMSVQAGQSGEFQEGVRALLIDKDGTPKWQFSSVSDVTDEAVAAFLTPKWSDDTHPLADM